MKLKPISASEAIRGRQLLPPSNRFEVLRGRDISASSVRDRSASAKRKASDSESASQQAPKRPNKNQVPVNSVDLETIHKKMECIQVTVKQVSEEIGKSKFDPALDSILRLLAVFMESSNSLQADLVSALSKDHVPRSSSIPNGPKVTVTPESSSEMSDSEMDTGFASYSQVTRRPFRPALPKAKEQLPPVDPKVKAFQEAVKSAEKSTLIFNLNLGTQKLLNEKSILSKATLALTAEAAKIEGKPPNKPSQDTIDILDDVLSIAQGVTIFGKSTKPYKSRKKEDPRSGTFCTVPVRYEFKDKDSRIAAEAVLREKCKVECTTPYPAILRHCIRQVIEHVREDYEDEYIRVSVEPSKFALKVARRTEHGWYNYSDLVKLPEEAYNVSARTVPEGLTIPNLPPRRQRLRIPSTADASTAEAVATGQS